MKGVVMRDRERAVLLLAGSLFDYLVMPETATGAMLRKSLVERKAAPMQWELCDPCAGTGEVTDRFRRTSSCERCGGKGRVKTDAYTGEMVGSSESQTAPPRVQTWTCNFCHGLGVVKGKRCDVCEGSGRREHSPFVLAGADRGEAADGVSTLLEDAILRRDQAGSYHELELCLAELARRSLHRHRVFHAVHVARLRQEFDLRAAERRWLGEAVRDLVTLMPAEIVVPRDVVFASKQRQSAPRGNAVPAEARAARDAEIVDRARSQTTREIADALGLPLRTVQWILDKEAAA